MKAKVQKWGNSLALRIPSAFAKAAHLDNETEVDLSLVDGKLLVSPMPASPLTLDELLAGVTEDNIHGEVSTGSAVGNEIW